MAEWDVSTEAAAKPVESWDVAKEAAPPLLKGALAPIKNIPAAIGEEFRSGREQVAKGFATAEAQGRGSLGTDADMISGAMQELFAPISGTAKALVYDPVMAQPDFPGKKMVATGARDVAELVGPGAVSKSFSALSKVMPGYSDSVKKLMAEGINLTPGQIMQGMFKRAEDSLSSVPWLGDIMKNGQYSSLKDFNQAILNRSLKEVGEKLPKDIENGRKSIAYADRAIGKKYDALLPKLTLQPDQQFLTEAGSIQSKNIKDLPEALRTQWDNIFDDAVDRLSKNKTIDGRDFKDIDSELGYKYRDYSRSPDPAHRAFANSIFDLRSALRANLERSNPQYQGELNKLNTAWAMFSRAQAASINRVKSGGIFSPADLLSAIKRQSTRSEFARGDAMLQDFADAANQVLPASVPDSGTVRRALAVEGAMGAGPFLLGHPGVAVGGAATALPYTRPGMKVVNKAAKKAPDFAEAVNSIISKSGIPTLATDETDGKP